MAHLAESAERRMLKAEIETRTKKKLKNLQQLDSCQRSAVRFVSWKIASGELRVK